MTGATGKDGVAGVSISSVTNKYAVSTSKTTAPTSWKDTPQTIDATNKYLWNYEIITYSNGNTDETDPRVIGAYGDKGIDGGNGKGIVSITEYFKVGTSKTTAPTGD